MKTIKENECFARVKYLLFFVWGIERCLIFVSWYDIKKTNALWVGSCIFIITLSFTYFILAYSYIDWGNIKLKSEKMVVWYVPKGFLKIKYEDINFIDIEPISDIVDYKVYGYSKKEQKIVYLSTNKGNYKIYCKTPKKLINAIHSQINKLN